MKVKTYFNSSMEREDYAEIKDEAYRIGGGLTVRKHISNILTEYATKLRKEVQSGKVKVIGSKR
jgi:hypothetical protein